LRYFLKPDFSAWFIALFKKLLYGFKHNAELGAAN